MPAIVDRLVPGTLVLLDESFASTNEREGAEIAHDVVVSLLEAGMRVYYVTHLFSLARRLAEAADAEHLFLRAQRGASGRRTFRLEPGPPEPSSHARDLYEQAFAVGAAERCLRPCVHARMPGITKTRSAGMTATRICHQVALPWRAELRWISAVR